MAHYAKIENNIVTQVIVAEPEFFDTFVDSTPGEWIQTSYNTRGGVHYGQDGEPDGGEALRKNYAGIGFTYDTEKDAFIPPKPYASWLLNEDTCLWEAPVAYPTDDQMYEWNEDAQTWDAVPEDVQMANLQNAKDLGKGIVDESEIQSKVQQHAPAQPDQITKSDTAPSSPSNGDFWYDTNEYAFKFYDGSYWQLIKNAFSAAGGTVTESGGYRIHTFTSSGTFQVNKGSSDIEYLVVAGGGGGATDGDVGGGGGAGGLLVGTTNVTSQSYTIVVGGGGSGGTSSYTPATGAGGNGATGGNSSAFSVTSLGGGYGGTRNNNGGPGGSGGGGGDQNNGGAFGGAGTTGQGYAGSQGLPFNANGGNDQGAGGGAGGPASSAVAGSGVVSDISGSSVTYAAGGRGQGPTTAAANTGNGGRGSATSSESNGGSGIVIIRYEI